MKVRKLLELQSTIEERAVPRDMNGELNKHYSESKEKEIDILDMDLIHLIYLLILLMSLCYLT